MQTNRHANAGALIGGALLIGFGLLSLVGQLFRGLNWGVLWPFTVIGFGVLFYIAMFSGGKQTAGFAIPATIISGIGLVLLIQNIFQHWEAMSYFWTLIIIFVGAGIYLMGWYTEDANQKHSGLKVMRTGLILFILFGAFFEMMFSSFNSMIFPILLIALGAYLVIARSGLIKKQVNEVADVTNVITPTDSTNSNDQLPPAN